MIVLTCLTSETIVAVFSQDNLKLIDIFLSRYFITAIKWDIILDNEKVARNISQKCISRKSQSISVKPKDACI